MFRDLPAHPAVKNTGLPWAPVIPDHWSVKRAKAIMRAIDVRSDTGEEELLTVSSSRGVVPRASANVNMFKAESYIGHKLCWPDDLVINSLWAWGLGLGVAKDHGIVSTAYGVYRQYEEALLPAYLHHLVRSEPFNWELHVRSQGVWKSRLQMTDDRWLDAPLLLPPLEEQAAIVKYLAHANARIDNAIDAKRRLIALLEEQQRVLVERAISECTASTERLGFHIDLVTGFPFKSEDFRTTRGDGQRPLLRGINVGVGSLTSTDYVFVDEDIAQLAQSFELRAGDLVLGMDRPVIAKGVRLAEITSQQAGCLLVQRVARLRTKSTLEPSYLQTVFRSAAFTQYLEPIFTGISVPHLSPKQIRDFPLPMPTIDEQRAIVAAVGSRTTKLESAVNVAAREVVLLQEFRTRLVADVVTGQVDVRAVAATLPNAPTSVLVADDVPAEADGPWENDDE